MVAHKCTPNSKSSHRFRKAHTEFEKPTPNSKSPHRIRKAHTEFEKPTPNSKSPHRIRKAHTKFEKPTSNSKSPHRIRKAHTEFQNLTPNSKTHTEFQNLTSNSKFNFEKLTQSVTPNSSPVHSYFFLPFKPFARWARNATVARCVFLHVIAIGISVCFVKTAGISTTHVRTIVRNAAQVRKFFYSCSFNRLMCRSFIKPLTLNHASHVVICVYSISLSD